MQDSSDCLESVERVYSFSNTFLSGRKDLRGEEAKTWKLLLSYDEIKTGVLKLANKIDTQFAGKDIVLVCILKGCVYFFVDLTRAITIPYSTYFIEASSYCNSQTQQDKVELLSVIVPSKFKNKTVILVDELFDNGRTLNCLRAALIDPENKLDLTADRIFTVTLFSKIKLTRYRPPDLVAIALPDIWVVGYGLDDKQEKRGWPHLYGVPKEDGVEKVTADKIFENNEEGETEYESVRTDLLSQIKNLRKNLPIQ